MHILRLYTLLVLFTLATFGLENHLICIEETSHPLANTCNGIPIDKNITLSSLYLENNHSIENKIDTIQHTIQLLTDQTKRYYPNIILYGKNFHASLLSVAYHNISKDYQKSIVSIILENIPLNLYKNCFSKKIKVTNRIPHYCVQLDSYAQTFPYAQSLYELSNAIDTTTQQDWFFPPVLYIDSNMSNRATTIDVMANKISLSYQYFQTNSQHEKHILVQQYIDTMLVEKSNRKIKKSISLNRYYPILRLHLGKIIYRSQTPTVSLVNEKYGEDLLQNFDIFYKKSSNNNPIFIYVHGGGWSAGDKLQFDDYAKYFSDLGFSAASINYRLLKLPDISMQSLVDDTQKAIEYIISHATKYKANPKKVIIMGESSGAQLLFMAVTNLSTVLKQSIKGIILNSMCSNLSLYSEEKQKRLSGIANKKERELWIKKFSPMEHLKEIPMPIIALHSDDDSIVIPKNMERLDLATVLTQNKLSTLWVSNANHPLSSRTNMMPSYKEIEKKLNNFILKSTKKNK